MNRFRMTPYDELIKVWAITPYYIEDFFELYYDDTTLQQDKNLGEVGMLTLRSFALDELKWQNICYGWCFLDAFRSKLGVHIGFQPRRKKKLITHKKLPDTDTYGPSVTRL